MPPNNPPFSSSSLKKPPLLLRTRPRPQRLTPRIIPIIAPMDKRGWLDIVLLISKKNFSKLEMVDLGLIFGGESTTLGSVSRIDVRDGIM